MKSLEWFIAAVILALMMMAEWRLVFYGAFEPLPLAGAVALIICSRSICQSITKLLVKAAPRRVSRKKSR